MSGGTKTKGMGGLCTKRSTVDNAPSGSLPDVNGYVVSDSDSIQHQSRGFPIKVNSSSNPSSSTVDSHKQPLGGPVSFKETNNTVSVGLSPEDDGIPRLSRVASHKSMSAKSKHVASAKVCMPCENFKFYSACTTLPHQFISVFLHV